MKDIRITVKLLAPLGTPWQSDTVFGHLAWHVARGGAPMSIGEFLTPFREGRPPFVLSDAFPGDLLPRPFLSARSKAEPRTVDEYALAKARQKTGYVTTSEFDALRRSGDTTWVPKQAPWTSTQVPHAAINRTTGTTTGGDDGSDAASYREECACRSLPWQPTSLQAIGGDHWPVPAYH